MKIFISHIHEEAPLAEALKEWAEPVLPREWSIFVSGDDILAGEDWQDRIKKIIQASKLCVALCSPASIERFWIIFEVGAAWLNQSTVLSILHGGLTPADLPEPLSRFHVLELGGKKNFTDNFFDSLAHNLQVIPRSSALKKASETYQAVLDAAEACKVKYDENQRKSIHSEKNSQPIYSDNDSPSLYVPSLERKDDPVIIEILHACSREINSYEDLLNKNVNRSQARYYSKVLSDNGLLELFDGFDHNEPHLAIKTTDKGLAALRRNDDLSDKPKKPQDEKKPPRVVQRERVVEEEPYVDDDIPF